MKAKMVAVSALAVVLVGAGSAVGAAASGAFGSSSRSHVPAPPGWVAEPHGGPGQGTVCFDAVCYRVDGVGEPYGPPLASD